MKRFLVFVTLVLTCGSLAQAQQLVSKKRGIERFAAEIAQAFAASDLGRLDRAKLVPKNGIKIVIEHSIWEEEGGIVVRHFPSFYRAERWLSNRHPQPGLPFRQLQEFSGCRKGSCSYDSDGGILHNQLYLKKILYSYRNGRLFIKEIRFLDGD